MALTTVGDRSARCRFRLTNDFVKFTLNVQEEQVASWMGDSDFDRWCQEILRVIKKAETPGRTMAELSRHSRLFRSLEPRQQDNLMLSLTRQEVVVLVEYTSNSGKGKPRQAWVAKEFVPELDTNEDNEDREIN